MEVVGLTPASADFGITLAAGVSCGPGTLIGVDSSGTGVLARDSTTAVLAKGIALSSGSGTKVAGISQEIGLARSAIVDNIDYATLTTGGVVYAIDAGRYDTTQGGTTNQVVGFALGASKAFIDLGESSFA